MLKKFVLAITVILLATTQILAAPLLSLNPIQYIERAISESSAIVTQEEAVRIAESVLAELKLSDTSELDIAGAQLDVNVAKTRLSELRAGTVTSALEDFVTLLFAERNVDHAHTALAISADKEAAAKNQANEGVKNQLDYITDYLAFKNAEISLTSAEYAYDNAKRKFLRRLPSSVGASVSLTEPELRRPAALSYSQPEVYRAGKIASSAYLQASVTSDLQSQRYTVFSELESSARTLRDLKLAQQNASRQLTAQEHALEDQAWLLVQQYYVLEARANIGDEQLSLAEQRWNERQKGFDFGVVTERQLQESKLALARDKDAQAQKNYALVAHYLKIIAFAGGDTLSEARRLLR